MVYHPMWVGTVRSCVVLSGIHVNFRHTPQLDSGPARADQWICPSFVVVLIVHKCHLEGSIILWECVTTEPKVPAIMN